MSIRNEKRERKNLANRLSELLRSLAKLRPKQETVLLDLSCGLDISGPLNSSKLPMEPTGFVVLHTSELQHKGVSSRTLCELQVVSMAVTYYRLYRLSGDAQDARSCARYCDWLEKYISCPDDYCVIVQKDLSLYLYPMKQSKDGIPRLPDWLCDGEGETV